MNFPLTESGEIDSRQMLLDAGIVKPSKRQYGWDERPLMMPHMVRNLKAKLIKLGIVIPKSIPRPRDDS